MNLLRKLKLFPLLVFVFSILFSASVTSCNQQAASDEDTEQTDEKDEAEKSEHPEGKADEHPTEKADTTKTDEQ